MIRFILNDRVETAAGPPRLPALDYLRREGGCPGVKEGCREGDCGSCTILLGSLEPDGMRYRAVASCLLPLGELAGCHVATIEGLAEVAPTPVQQAILREGASQCGFCTPGIVLALTGFLLESRSLSEEDALEAVTGNLCRCTGYVSIARAARSLASSLGPALRSAPGRADALARLGVVPPWFSKIPERLESLPAPPSPADAGAPPVAGGTDVMVGEPEPPAAPPPRWLLREPELREVRLEKEGASIGTAVPIEDLLGDEALCRAVPGLEEALPLTASRSIRNRATLGGNLANASPIGDLSVLMLALGAGLELEGKDGRRRTLPLSRFFLGYKRTALEEGEIIRSIRIPAEAARARVHFEKVSRRTRLDIASVNSAVSLEEEGGVLRKVRLAAGGVAPVPLLLEEAPCLLEDRPLSPEGIRAAAKRAAAEASPISDVRGSAAYKRELLRRLVIAHFIALFPDRKFEEVLP